MLPCFSRRLMPLLLGMMIPGLAQAQGWPATSGFGRDADRAAINRLDRMLDTPLPTPDVVVQPQPYQPSGGQANPFARGAAPAYAPGYVAAPVAASRPAPMPALPPMAMPAPAMPAPAMQGQAIFMQGYFYPTMAVPVAAPPAPTRRGRRATQAAALPYQATPMMMPGAPAAEPLPADEAAVNRYWARRRADENSVPRVRP